jgi:hypothetical protein
MANKYRRNRKKERRKRATNISNFFTQILSPSTYTNPDKEVKFVIEDDNGKIEHTASIVGLISMVSSLAQILNYHAMNDSEQLLDETKILDETKSL